MLFGENARRIYAFSAPIDMRKSFDGLLSVLRNALVENPLSGDMFVFVNRAGNYIKCNYWDRTGFCLFAKRLEGGRFKFPADGARQELSEQVFKLILDGICLGRRRQMR